MLFNSYIFVLVFLPLTAMGFFAIGKTKYTKLALAWLVFCSLFFYSYWNPTHLPLILASVVVNYCLGRLLNQPSERDWGRKLLLGYGIAGNIALLCYFKYFNFLVDSSNAVIGTDWSFPKIVLPLAISFFTFQQIAYLVDSYLRKIPNEGFLDYCLFVTFFPQLIAGPIVHHEEMLPQFRDQEIFKFNAEHVAVGITIFVAGLFKKVVLADNVSIYANQMFNGALGGKTPTMLEAWVGSLAYTLQLYFDFSGYSDMAIGLGRVFGIKLPLNFNSPYKATSIVDFWRRWHITLSRFLRQYLYIPLGGNRKGSVRRYVNLFITMLLGGLWHGAGWTFVFWGGLHGMYLCINHAWNAFCKRSKLEWLTQNIGWKVTAWAITFLAVMVGWIFFRAANFTVAQTVLASMVGLNGWELGPVCRTAIVITLLQLAIAVCFPNTQQLMANFDPIYNWKKISAEMPVVGRPFRAFVWQPNIRMGVAVAAVATISVLSMSKVQEFLYFQF